MKKVVRTSIKAETDAEMTRRHMIEEQTLLQTIQRQLNDLVSNIEDLHEVAYEEMELSGLFKEALDVMQAWPSNYRGLRNKYLEEINK